MGGLVSTQTIKLNKLTSIPDLEKSRITKTVSNLYKLISTRLDNNIKTINYGGKVDGKIDAINLITFALNLFIGIRNTEYHQVKTDDIIKLVLPNEFVQLQSLKVKDDAFQFQLNFYAKHVLSYCTKNTVESEVDFYNNMTQVLNWLLANFEHEKTDST